MGGQWIPIGMVGIDFNGMDDEVWRCQPLLMEVKLYQVSQKI